MKLFKKILVALIFFLCLFSLSACEKSEFLKKAKDSFHLVKEEMVERVKVGLSKVPFIKKYIHLPPAPSSLYEKAQKLVIQLRDLKAEKVYPVKFKEVLEAWEEADRFYRYKYYIKAHRKLEEVIEKAEALKKELEAYWASLEEKAWAKYKKVEKDAKEILSKKKMKLEEKLKIELYLWKLKTLVTLKRYDKFEKELKNRPF